MICFHLWKFGNSKQLCSKEILICHISCHWHSTISWLAAWFNFTIWILMVVNCFTWFNSINRFRCSRGWLSWLHSLVLLGNRINAFCTFQELFHLQWLFQICRFANSTFITFLPTERASSFLPRAENAWPGWKMSYRRSFEKIPSKEFMTK